MVNANLIGQVAVLIGDMSKKSVKFQQQQDTANTAMTNMQITHITRKKVREYLLNTQSTQDQQEELNDFLKNISKKFNVSEHIFSDVLKLNSGFSQLIKNHEESTVIQFIVRRFKITLSTPEKEIVKQDKYLTEEEEKWWESLQTNDFYEAFMYFIAKGEFNVFVTREIHTKAIKHRKLSIGDHFGEISMIYKCKRTATVTSSKYGTLGYICRKDYKDIVFKYQEVGIPHNT